MNRGSGQMYTRKLSTHFFCRHFEESSLHSTILKTGHVICSWNNNSTLLIVVERNHPEELHSWGGEREDS